MPYILSYNTNLALVPVRAGVLRCGTFGMGGRESCLGGDPLAFRSYIHLLHIFSMYTLIIYSLCTLYLLYIPSLSILVIYPVT